MRKFGLFMIKSMLANVYSSVFLKFHPLCNLNPLQQSTRKENLALNQDKNISPLLDKFIAWQKGINSS